MKIRRTEIIFFLLCQTNSTKLPADWLQLKTQIIMVARLIASEPIEHFHAINYQFHCRIFFGIAITAFDIVALSPAHRRQIEWINGWNFTRNGTRNKWNPFKGLRNARFCIRRHDARILKLHSSCNAWIEINERFVFRLVNLVFFLRIFSIAIFVSVE